MVQKSYIFIVLVSLYSIILSNAIEQNKKSLFTRGAGFWSTPKDEVLNTFFGKLTESKSQRENWYRVTPYIAEFWCAFSNIGFLYVGIKEQSPELFCAGLASIASHTIPKQWLLYVDKFTALIAVLKLAREYRLFQKYPNLIMPVAALGLINLNDVYWARYKGQSWAHVVWHLSAALLANYLLKIVNSVSYKFS